MASGPICHFMGNRWGNSGNSDKLYFGGLQNHCQVTAAMKLKDTLWKKSYDQPRQHTKIRDILMSLMTLMTFNGPKKAPSSQSFVFSSSHVWMWELDHKESWDSKNWCFWTVVVKTLESPWTARRSNQSILKEINPELEVLMSWSSNTLAT